MLSNTTECVILLHGMGRTSFSMKKIEMSLKRDGYRVVNVSYPSTRQSIPNIINHYVKPELLKLKATTDTKIHFVTHSLGGIVVRVLLQTEKLPLGSNIVMLCPPNQGSEIVDRYKSSWWYKYFNGPAGQVLGTDAQSLPKQLKAIKSHIGIITGNKSYDFWFANLFDSENDGKVSVQSAKLAEMKAFLVVNLGHTYIMQNKNVIKQIKYFLVNSCFHHRKS